MRRSALALDRTASFLAGLVLLGVGLAAATWGAGQLRRLWAASPTELQLRTATDAYAQSWWPWAAGATGLVLLAVAVVWLLEHLPRRGTGPLRLPGSSRAGVLTVDGDSATEVAAEVLGEVRGVRSATGRLVRERGHLLALLTVTAEPSTDLSALSAEIDQVSSDLRQVLGRDDVRARVRVRLARNDRTLTR